MPGNVTDVFISYSRKDAAFRERLQELLAAAGRRPWVDAKDIPLTSKWLAEIEGAIEASHTFLFIISPDSIASEVCRAEISYATQHHKKVIPIVYREVDPRAAPEALAEFQWLFFRAQDDLDAAFRALINALDTDLDHVRMHTRLLLRAKEWQSRGHANSALLRGHDLDEAEQWLREWGRDDF